MTTDRVSMFILVHCLWLTAGLLVPATAIAQACVSDRQCGSNFCLNGQCATPKADGQACGSYLECSSKNCVNRVCAPQGAAGGCTTGNQCGSGLCFNRQCVAALPNGASCSAYQQCQSKNCFNNLCTASKGNGAQCVSSNECSSGLCSNSVCTSRAGRAADSGAVPGRVSGGGFMPGRADMSNPVVALFDEGQREFQNRSAGLANQLIAQIKAGDNCPRTTQLFEQIGGGGGYEVYWPFFYRMAVSSLNDCAYEETRRYMRASGQSFSDIEQRDFGGALTVLQYSGPISNAEAETVQKWLDRMIDDGIPKDRLLLRAAKDCRSNNGRAREAVAYLAKHKQADLEYGTVDELYAKGPSSAREFILENCPDVSYRQGPTVPRVIAEQRRKPCPEEMKGLGGCGTPSTPPKVEIWNPSPNYVPTTPSRTR